MQTPNPRVLVVPGPEDVAATACRLVLEAEREAIARSGRFRIALAGGSTPRRLHELLAASAADFANWHVFFGDERWVPAGDARSNYRMARESLLARAPIPARQVHRIDTAAGTPAKAAPLYAMTLDRALAPVPGEMPRLDVALLGLGADGHTASLFPGSTALAAGPRETVVATWAPSQQAWRVTMTAAVFDAARSVIFVVSGADKRDALALTLGAGADGPPASRIRPLNGTLAFVVDDAAAGPLARSLDLPPSPRAAEVAAHPGH